MYFYHYVCKPTVDCFPLVWEGEIGCMLSVCVSTAEVMSITCGFKANEREKIYEACHVILLEQQ